VTTVATGELTPVAGESSSKEPPRDFLAEKKHAWSEHKSIPIAADLVGAALVLGRLEEAQEAGAYLLANAASVSPSVHRILRGILGHQARARTALPMIEVEVPDIHDSRLVVRRLRNRLQRDPRDAVLWIDLARHYAILGHGEKARRAAQRGHHLAPDSRFTLRSAARLLVHLGDPEHGHEILRRSEATRKDPWLLASEIAVATVAGRHSRLIKVGQAIIEARHHHPKHTSELASAIATLELSSGNMKAARKLFRVALEDPNDNTVAQAEWASRRGSNLGIEPRHLATPLSFEARAWEQYSVGKWRESLAECQSWLSDEPYSSRPAVLATFLASVALEDYQLSERVAKMGLLANPDDQTLLNNMVFTLASSGNLTQAVQYFERMDVSKCDEGARVAYLATSGLLEFRQGRFEIGRNHYREAVGLAEKLSDRLRSALASAFLAREEILATTSLADSALAAARARAEGQDAPILGLLIARLEDLQQSSRPPGS